MKTTNGFIEKAEEKLQEYRHGLTDDPHGALEEATAYIAEEMDTTNNAYTLTQRGKTYLALMDMPGAKSLHYDGMLFTTAGGVTFRINENGMLERNGREYNLEYIRQLQTRHLGDHNRKPVSWLVEYDPVKETWVGTSTGSGSYSNSRVPQDIFSAIIYEWYQLNDDPKRAPQVEIAPF